MREADVVASVPPSGTLRRSALCAASLLVAWVAAARAQTDSAVPTAAPAPESQAADDGWFDASAFLSNTYGFLPIVVPITEPAVGYGGMAGLMFLSKPLSQVRDGLGRPSITMVGGLGTENGTWGGFAGDIRYWLDDRLQTVVGGLYASVNLKYYGIGDDTELGDQPLHYDLEPKGGMVQAKYRIGSSRVWAGARYAFASTDVSFDQPDASGVPVFERVTDTGGLGPSLTLDTRDNFFTPTRGTYLDVSGTFFTEALGGDDDFQEAELVAMQYFPLASTLFLGFRGQGSASFGDEPFYLRPFIELRGAPVMRYQGEEIAQLEGELRWQFWKRLSLVGFAGGGAAWNDFERFDRSQTVVAGGGGLRYEIARLYGLHMGLDVGVGPEDTAIYVQVGSAWARP